MKKKRKEAQPIYLAAANSLLHKPVRVTPNCLANHKTHDTNKQKLHMRTSRTALCSHVLHPHEPNEVTQSKGHWEQVRCVKRRNVKYKRTERVLIRTLTVILLFSNKRYGEKAFQWFQLSSSSSASGCCWFLFVWLTFSSAQGRTWSVGAQPWNNQTLHFHFCI